MISKRTTIYLSKIYDQRFGNGTELGNSGWVLMNFKNFATMNDSSMVHTVWSQEK